MSDFYLLPNDIKTINDFVAFHKESLKKFIREKNKPHIYSCDIDGIDMTDHEVKNWKEYLESSYFKYFLSGEKMGEGKTKDLHPYLPVNPYSGDLIKAKVILLLLNPSISPINYFQNEHILKTRKKQYDYLLEDEPCYPTREWSMGFRYAIKILKPIFRYARKSGMSETETLTKIQRNIAVLQLSPYPSIEFDPNTVNLPTSLIAKKALNHLMTENGRRFVCFRGEKYWGIGDMPEKKRSNVICIKGRTPSLKNQNEIAKAVLEN